MIKLEIVRFLKKVSLFSQFQERELRLLLHQVLLDVRKLERFLDLTNKIVAQLG